MGTTTILEIVEFEEDATDTVKFSLLNDALDEFELGMAGKFLVSLTTGTVSLSSTQCRNRILDASGALSGNAVIELPASRVGFWVIKNGTTNAFTVDVTLSGGGAGTRVTQSTCIWIYADGLDVYPIPNTGSTKL